MSDRAKKVEFESLKQQIRSYLNVRNKLIQFFKNFDFLNGNDNIIGRIGEFIVYQYLLERKRRPIQAKLNQKGFDFLCDEKIRVSVKTITHENKSGRTTKINENWDELILIHLNEKFKVEQIGVITKREFNKALKENQIRSATPTASITMLNKNGLIGTYGKILDSKIINKYL
jgi:hypothetical protein